MKDRVTEAKEEAERERGRESTGSLQMVATAEAESDQSLGSFIWVSHGYQAHGWRALLISWEADTSVPGTGNTCGTHMADSSDKTSPKK